MNNVTKIEDLRDALKVATSRVMDELYDHAIGGDLIQIEVNVIDTQEAYVSGAPDGFSDGYAVALIRDGDTWTVCNAVECDMTNSDGTEVMNDLYQKSF